MGVLQEVMEIKKWSNEEDFDFWQRQFEQYLFGSFAIADACGETGHPEAAEALSREWKLGEVMRHGRWAGTEKVHNNVELWRSVARLDRGNSYFFEKSTSPRFKSEWEGLAVKARRALLGYAPWDLMFGPYLRDIAITYPNADVNILIYNPCDLVVGLYYVAAKQTFGYLPSLLVEVWEDQKKKRLVFSSLAWDGQTRPVTAEDILTNIYGDPPGYFAHRISGALDKTFAQLLSAHGFSMPVIETEWLQSAAPRVTEIKLGSHGIARVPLPNQTPPGESFLRFFEENHDYVASLVKFLATHSVGL